MQPVSIQSTASQDRLLSKTPNRKKQLLWALLPASIALAILLIWQQSSGYASLVIPRQQVQIATVERGALVRDIAAQGRIVAANAPTLYSQEAGQIEFFKQPGESVQVGELLARISSPALLSEFQQQQAVLSSLQSDAERASLQAREQQLDMEQILNTAQVNLLAARRELQRAQQSIDLGVIRKLDFDVAQDRLTQTELEFAHAERKVALAKDKLAFEQKSRQQDIQRQNLVVTELARKLQALDIKAPVTGQLGNWLVEQQSHVLAGQMLLTVIDLTRYEAELQVPESYARELVPGMTVEITVGNQQLPGQISSVAPEVRNNQVSARVRFADNDAQSLRQSQRLTARVILEEKQNVLKIPRGDFVASGGGKVAYQLVQGQAVKKPVELGALSVQWVEILSGASEGEQWVISNLSEFKDQARVNLN